jgi:hypothetical protein
MNQREEIMQAWNRHSATAYPSPQFKKAQAFFEMLNERPEICWDDLVAEFRRNYYDAFDEIVSVMVDTDNPLIMYNCVRFADLNNPREVDAAKNFIRNCDADKHQVSLQALAAVPGLQSELKKKPQLPAPVRQALGLKDLIPARPRARNSSKDAEG